MAAETGTFGIPISVPETGLFQAFPDENYFGLKLRDSVTKVHADFRESKAPCAVTIRNH
jgi:hypothetical protein